MKERSAYSFAAVLLLLAAGVPARTSDVEHQIPLVPEPKEVHLRDGGFRVGPNTRILVELGHQEEDRIAAETLAEEIQDQSGLTVGIDGTRAGAGHQGNTIVLARLQDRSMRRFFASRGLKPEPIGDQGYVLFSDRSHLVVAAYTGEGLFSGVQTLRQLLRQEGKNLICPAVAIRDWPGLDPHGATSGFSL